MGKERERYSPFLEQRVSRVSFSFSDLKSFRSERALSNALISLISRFSFSGSYVHREFARVQNLTSTVETRKTSRGNFSSRGFTRLRRIWRTSERDT